MIISDNRNPSLSEFEHLVEVATINLNKDAIERPGHYMKRGGELLEEDVERELKIASLGTPFQDTIKIVSGRHFPDIIATDYFGIEVKSTKKNAWTSTAGSVMESTRGKKIERIFLTFGKLSSPIEFRSRPYEECISGAAITHSPRYKIDMTLEKGKTIFDKMETTYDKFRLENPAFKIVEYYKSQMGDNERLWWANTDEDDTISIDDMKVKLAKELSVEEKSDITSWGLSLFPEILLERGDYEQFVLWMAAEYRVVSPSTRDFFTSGGRGEIKTSKHHFKSMPGDFLRINRLREKIEKNILDSDEQTLRKSWKVDEINKDRISQWIDCVCNLRVLGNYDTRVVLESIFNKF